MGDKKLQSLLRWGIENSSESAPAAQNGTNGEEQKPKSTLDPELMEALFGGPSEAELMKSAMGAITSTDPAISLDSKLIAFDNFEQLIESLDNANNISSLSLWQPLLSCLSHEETEIRRMAAWCVGTAVQNNAKSQEKFLEDGKEEGIPRLVGMVLDEGENGNVRRKAVYALSSAVRNCQPGMDVFVREMENNGKGLGDSVDAEDMDTVDGIMTGLRNDVAKD